MKFSSVIFWDVDYDQIDFQKNSRFVIGRVVRYGTAADWINLKSLYGLELIKSDMLNERDLDARSLSFLSCVLDTPQNQFRCYSTRQLHPVHSGF